jgi:oligopeptide transport system ATP-binding protein
VVEPILSVRNLVKHFPVRQGVLLKRTVGHVKAVDGVSFDLLPGETLGVVGESGCGKSTLAQVLMRLEEPTAGSATFEGRDIFKLRGGELRRLRREIQIVLQDPYTSLNPRMTVGDIVGEPFQIHTEVAPKGSRAQKVRELLEVVGLNPEHLNRYPHQFSGGQRQRIAIAIALACSPKVLIADEPTTALDVTVQAGVLHLLRDLASEMGLAVLLVTHDLGVMSAVADRVAVMRHGEVVEDGERHQVFTAPAHPYTASLLASLPGATGGVQSLDDVRALEAT